jgi:hypothetical protein
MNAGTMTAPFATLQKGVNTAAAGDTLWIRGGTYKITTPASSSAGVNFTKSGTSDTNRIKYWAYPGEVPLIDFSGMVISTSGYTNGFNVTGSYLHFKGLEIANVPMNMFSNNGISVNSAHDDIFESLNLHHNSGTGIFIGNGDGRPPDSEQRRARQLRSEFESGQRTERRRLRRPLPDDGHADDHPRLPRLVELRRRLRSDQPRGLGHRRVLVGDGQRLRELRHHQPARRQRQRLQDGQQQDRRAAPRAGQRRLEEQGVGLLRQPFDGRNTWYNNTSFQNGTQYNMLASPADMPDVTITLTGTLAHIMRNNIGFPNRNSNMTGVDTMFNSWDSSSLAPANGDFASVTDPAPRRAGKRWA